ncbi:MAG: hypothetical protein F6J97_20090 [Leptolyngbya sp. SIO4C1]|nr:hypothetical protein [Leptolyngbya sp. SIO4C1]
MKSGFFIGLTAAIASLVALPVQAQMPSHSVPSSVLNGILVNNSSQEFFEAGRDRFEAEIRALTHSRAEQTDPILTIRNDARNLRTGPSVEPSN